MTKDKDTLELNVRSKDWSAKAFDNGFGGLTIDDFVNLYELGELYADEARDNDQEDNSYEMLVEITGLDDPEFGIGDNVKYSLIGIYLAIGSRIVEDRWVRSLDPATRHELDKWTATLTNAQEALRALPDDEKRKFIKRVRDE